MKSPNSPPPQPHFQFGLRRFALSIALFAAAAACLRWMAQLTRDPAMEKGWIVFVVGSIVLAACVTAAVSVLFRTGVWATINDAAIGASVMFVLITLFIVILIVGITLIS